MRSTVKTSGQPTYLSALNPHLSTNNPVFEFDLTMGDARLCASHLRAFAISPGRDSLTLACPSVRGTARVRMTITTSAPPAYEQRAAAGYVRGTALRVQAGASSCNLVLQRPGAAALADVLDAAVAPAQALVHVQVDRG